MVDEGRAGKCGVVACGCGVDCEVEKALRKSLRCRVQLIGDIQLCLMNANENGIITLVLCFGYKSERRWYSEY